MQPPKFRKKKTKSGDWIVANDTLGTHAHFRTKFGASVIIYLIKNGIEPENPYFIESKRRLLGAGEPRKFRCPRSLRGR